MDSSVDAAQLRKNFDCEVIVPADASYEEARITYTVKDARPAIIIKAKTSADVSTAITYAKENDLQISIRSGGHSAAGFSINNDGVVIDLSLMNTIEIINEDTGTVRLGPGAHWGDVASELGKHNLALTSGDTKSVGVGGLTLNGGIGWMLRKYGYAIDSMTGAEVVLADGSIVHADETENDDLFWALRGGGGNFGVVTSFEFKAHPQGKVVESIIMYGIENVKDVITGWRDHMRNAPEELTSFMTLMPGFPGFAPSVMVMSVYADENEDAANKAIEPLRHLDEVVSDNTAIKDYADVLQEAHPPEGVKFVVKSMYAKKLSDELAAELAEACCKPGSPIVQLRMMNGAIDNIDIDATAMPHRNNEIFLFAGFPIPPNTPAGSETEVLKAWVPLSVHSTGAYGNFVSTVTDEDIASIYPSATYKRLSEIKAKYDPDNFFNHNFNIKPAK